MYSSNIYFCHSLPPFELLTSEKQWLCGIKALGNPFYNAIAWQGHRTADFCDQLKNDKFKTIIDKAGLVIDAYFSATKIKWISDSVKDALHQKFRMANNAPFIVSPCPFVIPCYNLLAIIYYLAGLKIL